MPGSAISDLPSTSVILPGFAISSEAAGTLQFIAWREGTTVAALVRDKLETDVDIYLDCVGAVPRHVSALPGRVQDASRQRHHAGRSFALGLVVGAVVGDAVARMRGRR